MWTNSQTTHAKKPEIRSPPRSATGRFPPNGGQITLVPVVEGITAPARDGFENVLRGMLSLLHRYGRGSRQRRSCLLEECSKVSYDERLLIAGHA